jgi:hypothetical protein
MRKKPLTDTEVLFTHAKSPVRTSALGDASLGGSLLQRAGGVRLLEDRVGLDRAYQQGDSYTRNSTLFIAGSHTARDWYDDVTKIPFWGDVKKSHRYQQADKMLTANPQVRTVTGHSLGGAVAHELQRAHPELRTVTYGAPSVSWGTAGGEGRYRNSWDPVSMFDRGATRLRQPRPLSHGALTHDYHNSDKVSGEDDPKAANPDGSVSITE